jgi:hypothetical protein
VSFSFNSDDHSPDNRRLFTEGINFEADANAGFIR